MSHWVKKLNRIIEEQGRRESLQWEIRNFPALLLKRLSEIEKRKIAIEIYSEYLDCNIWLCSGEGMAVQIRRDNPGVIIYDVKEMREHIKLKPHQKT
ncbi:MAG: hypothetical protein ACHQ6U_09570 [Thermodesulfobacteriota bacterium]